MWPEVKTPGHCVLLIPLINYQVLPKVICFQVTTDNKTRHLGKVQNSTSLCSEVIDEGKNSHFSYFCFLCYDLIFIRFFPYQLQNRGKDKDEPYSSSGLSGNFKKYYYLKTKID